MDDDPYEVPPYAQPNPKFDTVPSTGAVSVPNPAAAPTKIVPTPPRPMIRRPQPDPYHDGESA